MPCYDGQSAFQLEEEKKHRKQFPHLYAAKDVKEAVERMDKLLAMQTCKVYELTDMLCRLCECASTTEIENGMPYDIFQWWEEHKKFDKERKNEV